MLKFHYLRISDSCHGQIYADSPRHFASQSVSFRRHRSSVLLPIASVHGMILSVVAAPAKVHVHYKFGCMYVGTCSHPSPAGLQKSFTSCCCHVPLQILTHCSISLRTRHPCTVNDTPSDLYSLIRSLTEFLSLQPPLFMSSGSESVRFQNQRFHAACVLPIYTLGTM